MAAEQCAGLGYLEVVSECLVISVESASMDFGSFAAVEESVVCVCVWKLKMNHHHGMIVVHSEKLVHTNMPGILVHSS